MKAVLYAWGNPLLSVGVFFLVISCGSQFIRVALTDNTARLRAVGRSHNAALFEHIDEFCRARVPDAKLALQVRSGCLARFYDRLLCVCVEFVVFVVASYQGGKYRVGTLAHT